MRTKFALGIREDLFDIFEGGQDIVYGLSGNQEAVSWNVVRDTAFKGHEEEYYLVEALLSQGAATGTQLVEGMGYAETARMEGAAARNPGSKEGLTDAVLCLRGIRSPRLVNIPNEKMRHRRLIRAMWSRYARYQGGAVVIQQPSLQQFSSLVTS